MKKLFMYFVALLFIVGSAAQAFAVSSINNNFTMLDPTGALVGGTNDVVFAWDGTQLASVAASGQVSNATLSSVTPFFGVTWSAHEVAIYGPGTYTVYADCPAGSPGCGIGTPITFTVGDGELGVHMLFDWGGNNNIDVVDVWAPSAMFGPSPMYTGPDGTLGPGSGRTGPGYGDASWVWSLMSSDWNGDGINGSPMVDGPFSGFNANFNVNYVGTTNNNLTVLDQVGGLAGGFNDVVFIWNEAKKTSVAASGQIPNAAMYTYALDGFFETVLLHDVAVYGPGTYTIYTDCPPGSPGCGTGTPITFTVGAGQLGVHLLYDYVNYVSDWDIVNIWIPDSAFGPSPLYTGPSGGTADPATVWDWMSSDWNGDGINGYPTTEGPFLGFSANVNVMGAPSPAGCVPADCDDNDACTIDSCDPAAGCVHTAVVCEDGNACTTDSCDPATGICSYVAVSCDDDNICTDDSCNPASGCLNTPNTAPCDDGNVCTSNDTCADGVCAGSAVVCNDSDLCTVDSCNTATGCVFTPISCDDGNVCTEDTCDTATGACKHSALSCINTTNNNFTMLDSTGASVGGTNDVTFSWDGTQKTSVATSGQVGNALLSSSCPFFGVTWSAHDVAIYGPGTYTVYAGCAEGSPGCGTGTPITFTVGASQVGGHMLFNWGTSVNMDVVNVWEANSVFNGLYTGACGSNPPDRVWDLMSTDWDGNGINGAGMVDGPFVGFNVNFNLMAPCAESCDDGNACTTDFCRFGSCVHTPSSCDDGNACTTDSCNTAMGCVNTLISCNDGNACTTDSCNPASGCVNTPLTCDDGNACTNDSCDPATGGCIYIPISCNDNNACTADTCDPATGCVYIPISCDDGNACTTDSCNPASGCVHTPISCDDGNACTNDSCDPTTGCVNITINCDDGNACTTDSCDPATGCVNTADTVTCPVITDNNFTMIDPTNALVGGDNSVVFAWDGTMKTSVAASGQVSNATLRSTCMFFGNFWTAHDVTVYGPGSYTIYSGCAAGSPGCGAGAPISFTVNAGEIGIHLLIDWGRSYDIDVVNVMKSNALFAPSSIWTGACGSSSACTVWQWTSYDFDGDGINGTSMVDGPFVGFNANFNLGVVSVDLCCDAATRCNDGDACTADSCDSATGACINTPISCDDGNACTNDSCDPASGCVHTAINCDDGNACTTDTCDPAIGCVNTPISCDDVNACTADSCDTATGCVNTPISCDDGNACTTDSCDPASGCVHTAINCDDNNACSVDSCTAGVCAHTYIPGCDPQCAGKPNGTPCEVERIWYDPSVCYNDYCSNGVCLVGPEFSCDDGNACTTDTCDPASGCVHTTINCDDGNACTTDSCDPATGCVYTAVVCDDGNECTSDSCDPATGTCASAPAADGTACTVNSAPGTCQSGTCVPACPAGSVQFITIRGGGQKPTSVDLQIQTRFTALGGGCITGYTDSNITVTPGTVLSADFLVGNGPDPSSGTWMGNPISVDAAYTITGLNASGDSGVLTITNKDNGGKDTDRMTIRAQ